MEGRLEEEGFVGGDGEAEVRAEHVGEEGDGVGKRCDNGVDLGGRRVAGGGGDKGAVGEGGVIMNEGEEEGGAAGDKVDRENEGEGDAEVVLGEGLALIGGVGLVVDVEGVVDLDESGAREGIVGEGIEDGEVVEVVA